MAWKYFSVSTVTWGGKVQMPAFDFTGGCALNSGRSGTAVFKIGDPWVAEVVTRENLEPWERLLVAEWEGQVVYAGFITDIDEDPDTSTVTVGHVDIWVMWALRHILTVRGNGDQSAPPMPYGNRTLATLANLAVAKGMDGVPANRYALPIVMNADVAGPHARTYYGYKFTSVADALTDIMNTTGGPDIDFDPQWDATENFRWVMRSGALTLGLWEWDATTPKSEVSALKLKTDAAAVTNKVIGSGEGSERNMLVRDAASFTGTASPALERVTSYQGISDGGQLQSRVTADLNASNDPVQQLSFRIPVGGTVSPVNLTLGGTARVKTSGLLFLADGWHDWRLIQFDFDREWITLQFQPKGG